MKKKLLLAGGCSYTEQNFDSTAHTLPDDGVVVGLLWPEIMGKE